MKTFFKNKRFFLKYLISYIFILIVPIFFLGIYVNNSILKTLEEEIYTNDLNTLVQMKNNVEYTLEHTSKIKEELYLETYRSPFLFETDPLRGLELLEELKSYKVTNPFIDSIFLYFTKDDYIYRSTGTAPINMFINEIYNIDNWDENEFLNTIRTTKEIIYRPGEMVHLMENNTKAMTTIIYPLFVNQKNPYAVVIFAIPKSFYDSHMNNQYGSDKISVILNNTNDIISMSIIDEDLKEEVKKLLGSVDNLDHVMLLDDESYKVTSIKSETTGWKYLTLTSGAYIKAQTSSVRKGFMLGIALVFLIGMIGIGLFMQMNYQPIRRLRNYSSSFLDEGESGKGELELVRAAINSLSVKNEELSIEVEDSNIANRQYITRQVLKGGKPFRGQLEEQAIRYGLILYKFFAVVITYVNSKEEYTKVKEDIILSSEKAKEDGLIYYSTENFDNNKIISIVTSNNKFEDKLSKHLVAVQELIKKNHGISTSIGISDVYTNTDQVPKAYIEASTAVDYRLVKGSGCILKYKEIIGGSEYVSGYPTKQIENIGKKLKDGEIEAIEKELDQIVDYINMSNAPIFVVRGLCFDIINKIIQSSQKIVGKFCDSNVEIPDVFTLSQYDTVDELISIIKGLSHDLCTGIIKQKNKEELSVLHEMVVYINNNFTDMNFSLMGMADYFNISQSSLSMYFKDKTGQTILNHITKMKIDKAKELLTTTKLNVNDIAGAIGYNNVTSFIRRFKQWENITPGEYRKKYS